MKLQHFIEQHWYHKTNLLLTLLLLPFSLIYGLVVRICRTLFNLKLKSQINVGVPVVIIGNIGVGGAGKHHSLKAIATDLIARGIKIGIVLRVIKGCAHGKSIVTAKDSSSVVGDEALIYAKLDLESQ